MLLIHESCYNSVEILHRRKGDIMAKVITYECKECGCEIVVSGSHETHLRPIYCCGVEVAKISPASKGTVAKKTTEKKVINAVKKITKKTTVKKPVKKKATAGKKTSGR
jgi:hypothetical protein